MVCLNNGVMEHKANSTSLLHCKRPLPTFFSVFCAWGMTIMGSSSSVVMTVSLLPKVNIVERFLRGARLEKKPGKILRQGAQLNTTTSREHNHVKHECVLCTCTATIYSNSTCAKCKVNINKITTNVITSKQKRPIREEYRLCCRYTSTPHIR